MGRRKGQIAAMGSSVLVKDRRKSAGRKRGDNDSFLHTTDINDGVDYNRINFQSVTEQSNLEDFLTTAEIAGKDFTAERQNIQVIANPGQGIKLTEEDMVKISEAQDSNRQFLQIPRRPEWDENTTKEELNLMERESFTDWRRKLNILEEKEHIQMTPYERNLDFWRQLWRVIERSDVIVQIVDARNPLLFRCDDLDVYVKEVDSSKSCILLINKADYLNARQRQHWVDYFNKEGIMVVFFSAKTEKEKFESEPSPLKSEKKHADIPEESIYDDEEDLYDDDDDEEEESDEDGSEEAADEDKDVDEESASLSNCMSSTTISTPCDSQPQSSDSTTTTANVDKNTMSANPTSCSTAHTVENSPSIVSANELLDIFRKVARPNVTKEGEEVRTIGMVGYPNVGKSSTINVIFQDKKLGVSATPGRTKHLQTLYVDSGLVLCDCPGLVFPSFVATKAHLVVNGILPIDELRDHVPPTELVCGYIPRPVLEATYSIMIPRPSVDDLDPDRPPTAEEMLTAYGAMRGFMTPRGVPDKPRASRYILKDFVKGKLLYCNPPPGIDGVEFQDSERHELIIGSGHVSKQPPRQIVSELDRDFFKRRVSKANSKGKSGVTDFVRTDGIHHTSRVTSGSDGIAAMSSLGGSVSSIHSMSSMAGGGKSWKKHNNRNKKEKLRRVHKDLDIDI